MAADSQGQFSSLLLFPGGQPTVTPCGIGQYLVALQNKAGELEVLRHASDADWDGLTPLIHFVGPKKSDGVLTERRLDRWVERVASAVGRHPCLVDIARLRPTQRVGTPDAAADALFVIYQACRRRGLRFVPVLPFGASDRHMGLIRDAVAIDRNGVCLRYLVREFVSPSGSSFSDLAEMTLHYLGVRIEEADLILDLGFLGPDTNLDVDGLLAIVDAADVAGPWRSLALLGTSIPPTMACIDEGTVGRIPRREWQIWQEVGAKSPRRIPSYGDYAIQNPKPPQDGGGPGMRANVRYTLDAETVVARGTGPLTQLGKEQYHDLCDSIVSLPEFSGPGYTWGDRTIFDCAWRMIEPGGQKMWRGAGTSHHIRLVQDQLRTMVLPPLLTRGRAGGGRRRAAARVGGSCRAVDQRGPSVLGS